MHESERVRPSLVRTVLLAGALALVPITGCGANESDFCTRASGELNEYLTVQESVAAFTALAPDAPKEIEEALRTFVAAGAILDPRVESEVRVLLVPQGGSYSELEELEEDPARDRAQQVSEAYIKVADYLTGECGVAMPRSIGG